ncbi:MAG: flagellar motor protein [Moorellaceae bacterium]
MDFLVLLGIAIGFVSLLVAFVLEGGELVALLGVSPFLIVIGGTLGATLVGLSREELRSLPALLKAVLMDKRYNLMDTIETLTNYAVLARKEGLVRLEQELNAIEDNFLRTALQLIVDATDPEQTRHTLEQYIYATSERHAAGIKIFEAAGGYAPTMGIIGTVMGLIHVLSNISSPDKLGPSIALAFIATLYGVSTANLIWLPLAAKLKNKSDKERLYQELVLEGVLAIQAGKSPSLLRNTLLAFVPPAEQREQKVQGRAARESRAENA